MKILSEGPFDLSFLDARLQPMGKGRSKGLHQSQVISYIGRTAKNETTWTKPGEEAGSLFTDLGFLFEGWIERMRHRQGLTRPKEMKLDGIAMTPDGIDEELEEVQEYKLTFKSMRKWQEAVAGGLWVGKSYWHWPVQAMGYCAALGYRRARFIVCFPMGDYTYRDDPKKRVRELVVEFTDFDIVENWRMILANAPAAAAEIGVTWRQRRIQQ